MEETQNSLRIPYSTQFRYCPEQDSTLSIDRNKPVPRKILIISELRLYILYFTGRMYSVTLN